MKLSLCTLELLALSAAAYVAGLDLTITNKQTVEIPHTLGGGYMWEDINHSGDGGLYAELLQNRAFQIVTPGTSDALNAWKANGTTISVVNNTPGVSSALPNSLSVAVPSSPSGTPGFMNTGYWGIKVQAGWTYTGSLYAKSPSYSGPITVSLKSSAGKVYDTAQLTTPKLSSGYQKFTFTFKPTVSAPNTDNVFTVELDPATSGGSTVYFGMFTLFPPTYKNRPNGMRIDLAEAMTATIPGVWRFPGGNNLEGSIPSRRWKWNETIGPLENRPGRQGDWTYPNTDGLGLMEYLNWAEDMNATVILGIYSGYSLDGVSVPQSELQPYIDDAIAEIQFVTSDASANKWGALRASLGRQEPYKVDYIEIGNEDFLGKATPSYHAYRWNMFVTQLSAKFPDKHFLATSNPSLTLTPAYTYIDFHKYQTHSWFESSSFMFDDYPRNNTKYFVGEYAVTSTNSSDIYGSPATGRMIYPTVQGAVAEAAYMTGMERNADVVFAAAYAPTLQHINSTQWTPDLITFDANTLVKSTSYYAQQMFGQARGTNGLATTPVSNKAAVPLYWSASINLPKKQVILKIVNAGNTAAPANVSLQYLASSTQASVVSLSPPADGNISAYNTLTNPNLIVPKPSTIDVAVNASAKTSSFTYTLASHSIAVITVSVQ